MAESEGRQAGVWLAAAGAVGFSFKAILVKLAYPYGLDAITLLALRMIFSLPLFVAMAFLPGAGRGGRITARDHAMLILLGFLGYYLSSFLDFLGLQYISAGLERLVLFLYPTLVVLISALALGKPVTRRLGWALVLSYGGIALAMVHDLRQAGNGSDVWLGAALVFGGAVSYALYLIGNGQAVDRLGATRLTAYASTVACLACIGQFLLTRPLSSLALPWQAYGLALAMALFSTVLPVYMVSEAIRRIGAGPVSLIGSLGPIATIFLGWLMLGESISLWQLVGAALVLAGVLMVGRK
ncbi:MAG: DMT family transporter [Pseudomonadota bacterium]